MITNEEELLEVLKNTNFAVPTYFTVSNMGIDIIIRKTWGLTMEGRFYFNYGQTVSIAYFWSLGEEVSSVGYIYRKLDSEDYLISNHVVDCPSKVKIYLYKDIKCNKELYIRFVPQKQELQFYTNDGKVTYYWVEKSADKNDFEYQMYYFAKQLIPNKFYIISDIITDKALRNLSKVHK